MKLRLCYFAVSVKVNIGLSAIYTKRGEKHKIIKLLDLHVDVKPIWFSVLGISLEVGRMSDFQRRTTKKNKVV